MKKLIALIVILLAVVPLESFSQRAISDTVFYGSNGAQRYRVRYWYDPSKSDSCQAFVFIVGLGEMNTNIAGISSNGPFAYQSQGGWDGGVPLGNGTHYPIIIAIQPAHYSYGRPDNIGTTIFEWIWNRFPIKRNSLHACGLSQGAYTWNLLATFQKTSGTLTYGPRIKSIVNAQGVIPNDANTDIVFQTPPYPQRFAAYAQAGGREVGLWGTQDGSRGIPQIVSTMNAAVPGSAIEISENVGHSGWQRYFGGSTAPNNYTLDGKSQTLYQWMLRQGDTVNTYFVSNGSNTPPVANAGPDRTITLPLSSVDLSGKGTDTDGTIASYAWSQVSGPNTASIPNNTYDTTRANGLVAGTYVFRLTVTDDDGATGTDNVTVTVEAEPTYSYTRLGLGEYQAFLIDPQQKLWGLSNGKSAVGAGTDNGSAVPPVPVLVDNKKIRNVSSGLHHSVACDTDGNVWTWGWNEQGQAGNGTYSSIKLFTPHKILTDSAGNTFTDVIDVETYYSANAYSGSLALKKDGTVWIWGGTGGGMRGDGTDGGIKTRPVQVQIPKNRVVKSIKAGQVVLVLCTDGTVWAWGGNGARVHNLGRGTSVAANVNHRVPARVVSIPTNIKAITGGGQFSYALTEDGVAWGWGYYGSYMSIGSGGYSSNQPTSTPKNLTTDLGLPHPIRKIVVNDVTTHAILTDGTLWGWGDNAVGCIGNGVELDFSEYDPPYAWTMGPGQLLQQDPVQILPQYNDWIEIYGGTSYVYYKYAQRSNGQLYSWGRNKTGTLGNGVVGAHSSILAVYPNSWDVPLATAVDPLSLTSATVQTSPFCLENPDGWPCNLYKVPTPDGPKRIDSFKAPRGGMIKVINTNKE